MFECSKLPFLIKLYPWQSARMCNTNVHLLKYGLQVGGVGAGQRRAQVTQVYRVVHHPLTLRQHVVQRLSGENYNFL